MEKLWENRFNLMPFGNSAQTECRSATGLWVGGCGCCHTSQEHHTGRMFAAAKPVTDRRSVIITAQPFGNFRKALRFNPNSEMELAGRRDCSGRHPCRPERGVDFCTSLEFPVSCVARAFLSAGQARMPAATSEVGFNGFSRPSPKPLKRLETHLPSSYTGLKPRC